MADTSSLRSSLRKIFRTMVQALDGPLLKRSRVITWGSPVPVFGDLLNSSIATLGINPSDLEFLDHRKNELDGVSRRLHSLGSLKLKSWRDATENHLEEAERSCLDYFCKNPYRGWFDQLETVIGGTGASFYAGSDRACHLDLVPYATQQKWGFLNQTERTQLLRQGLPFLGDIIRASKIRLLVLNGRSVLNHFSEFSKVQFQQLEIKDWTLRRKAIPSVKGFAYRASVDSIGGISLGRTVRILGYNHNLQSSYGVTKEVRASIRDWITQEAQ